MKDLMNPSLLPVLMGLVVITALLSGSYPALFLSSFQPVHALKVHSGMGTKSIKFRKSLVVMQFFISVFLIVGTLVIHKQLAYIETTDIGYDRDNLIHIPMEGDSRNAFQRLKTRLIENNRIVSVTGVGDDLPYFGWSTSTAQWQGKDPDQDLLIFFNYIDYDFIETLGIEMAEGRPFSKEFSTDAENGVIVNETMARLMGIESAVGHEITNWGETRNIVGVIKDTHFQPLTRQIRPRLFLLDRDHIYHVVIRIDAENRASTLDFIQETWEEINPQYPFQYRYLQDDFTGSYRNIRLMGRLTNSFTFIAIFIACLGLLGLASYTSEKRAKEIGIRKVLGSSVFNIFLLLSKEFTRCVLIANVLAWPMAYFVCRYWLREFVCRIRLGVDPFIISLVLVTLVSLLTVSYQAIKAACANPAEALKYE
jgi:putative ABC transport system permease protein